MNKIGNDKIKSVKVPAGMKVTLYEHSGFSGQTIVLTSDAGQVNLGVSGVKVEQQ